MGQGAALGPTAKRRTTAPLHPTLHFLFLIIQSYYYLFVGDETRGTCTSLLGHYTPRYILFYILRIVILFS